MNKKEIFIQLNETTEEIKKENVRQILEKEMRRKMKRKY